MDPKKHPLVEVADLLTELRPARRGTYLLHAYHGNLNCCLLQLAPKDAAKIAVLIYSDINKGLAPNIWQGIEDRIHIYLRQGVLKWQPPKP